MLLEFHVHDTTDDRDTTLVEVPPPPALLSTTKTFSLFLTVSHCLRFSLFSLLTVSHCLRFSLFSFLTVSHCLRFSLYKHFWLQDEVLLEFHVDDTADDWEETLVDAPPPHFTTSSFPLFSLLTLQIFSRCRMRCCLNST